jgi:predicted amidohydrolase YtcJ
MTFWGAYAARMEREIGALSAPLAGGQPGWFADIVVWRVNPFAIRGTDGPTLESMARSSDNEAGRLATVNAVISRFLPQMTIVAGIPVYTRS